MRAEIRKLYTAHQAQLLPLRQDTKALSRQSRALIGLHARELPHHRRSRFLVPLYSTSDPVDSLAHACTGEGTDGQHSRIPNAASFLALKDLLHEPFLDPYNLDAVLTVLLVGKDEDRHAFSVRVLQHVLED